jgi:hypothetical protein
MNNEAQTRVQHFAALKYQYQATKYEDSSPSSLLYLILRKADLGIEITEIEWDWLRRNELLETIHLIWLEQHRADEPKRLEAEFSQLRAKYKVPENWDSPPSSFLYPILWKLDYEGQLADSDLKLLRDFNLLETISIAQQIIDFTSLKAKYQASRYQDYSPDSHLYQILKQLDTEERLSDEDVNWLRQNELLETLEIFRQQEETKDAEFAQLKDKYQVTRHPETSASSLLYPLLQQIDSEKLLTSSEINWLHQQGLHELIAINQELEQKQEFAVLKVKYKAIQYEDSSPSSRLYTIFKSLESGNLLSKADLIWLTKRELTDTISLAIDKSATTLKSKIETGEQLNDSQIYWLRNNGREDVIALAQQKHFAGLKVKYRIVDPRNELPLDPFYTIMQKLEREERLDPVLVVQLIEQELLAPNGKIAMAYHRLEALFYEQGIKRTGDKWKLPTASSHWRKADEPWRALQLTNTLNIATIKGDDLKSAILVSRGAAFRDIQRLDEAKECAMQAINYHPETHQPYTLMGAICIDRGEYSEGNEWFDKAIERGAESEGIDDEVKRVVRNARDENKRREVVEYLLQKDPIRYAWAKSYRKN